MNNIEERLNDALEKNKHLEGSFYKEYIKLSKEYEILIKKGLTKRRKPIVVSILDGIENKRFNQNIKN